MNSKMFGDLLLFLSAFLTMTGLGCASHPHNEEDVRRSTAAVEPSPLSISPNVKITTRDGKTVPIPELRKELVVPECTSVQYDECRPPGEQALLDKITRATMAFQTAQNPATVKTSQRDFHAKQHACLAGVWTPSKNMPPELKVGAFALKEPARVVLRYSNGNPKLPGDQLTPDTHPEPRGLAIKMVDIPGDSILNLKTENGVDGLTNQDFVLINYPQFFLRTPARYPEFMEALTAALGGSPGLFVEYRQKMMDKDERAVMDASNSIVSDEVAERFFSEVPYVLNGVGFVKYRVQLCNRETIPHLTAHGALDLPPNFLSERIAERLEKGPICLTFAVQQKAPKMKVEDATELWKEPASKSKKHADDESPFVEVARIRIPPQDIKDPERLAYCENASFNPWNSLEENRPAGAINRARLAVYTGISRKRRMENPGVEIREPRANDRFFDVLDK